MADTTTERPIELRNLQEARAAAAATAPTRTRANWLERQVLLPLQSLSDEDFELLTYMLLTSEEPDEEFVLYGKTADRGRDLVRKLSVSSVEVIQCKRYEVNVGLPIIREDLAKLIHAEATKSIPHKVEKVIFYATKDLTSPATDYLSTPEKWAVDLLPLIGEMFPKEDLAPVRAAITSWQPKATKVSGADITTRLQKHPELIDTFFATKKVIEGRLADLDPKFAALQETMSLLLQTKYADATEALQLLLTEAERRNPGLRIRASTQSGNTVYRLTASTSPEAPPLAILHFAEDDRGRQAEERLRQGSENGREVALYPGEYRWAETLTPFLPAPSKGVIVIQTSPPPRSMPVTLRALREGTIVASVPYAIATVVRAGTKEIEFDFRGGQFGAVLGVASHPDGPGTDKIQLTLKLDSVRADAALATINLLREVLSDAMLQVHSLEIDKPLIEMGGFTGAPFSPAALDNTAQFLRMLGTINRACDLDLSYPALLSSEDSRAVEIVARCIDEGAVAEPINGSMVELDLTPEFGEQLIEIWERSLPADITTTLDCEYRYGGILLPTGPELLTLEAAHPADGLDDLIARCRATSSDATFHLRIVANRFIHRFEKWTRQV